MADESDKNAGCILYLMIPVVIFLALIMGYAADISKKLDVIIQQQQAE